MLKKVAISQIRIGMHVNKIEGSWLEHDLWQSRFTIEDDATLERLRECGARECWIDTALGLDVEPTVEAATPAAAPAPKAVERKTMADELQNAANVLKRSKSAVTSLFAEARMGNAV